MIFSLKCHFVSTRNHNFYFVMPLSEGIRELIGSRKSRRSNLKNLPEEARTHMGSFSPGVGVSVLPLCQQLQNGAPSPPFLGTAQWNRSLFKTSEKPHRSTLGDTLATAKNVGHIFEGGGGLQTKTSLPRRPKSHLKTTNTRHQLRGKVTGKGTE